MESEKVLIPYKDPSTDQLGIESIQASPIGEHYKLDNVPFLAKNFALGDIVAFEKADGGLYVDSLRHLQNLHFHPMPRG